MIEYEGHRWQIYRGLKVIVILLLMQLGYTKYCRFLCGCDGRRQVFSLQEESLTKALEIKSAQQSRLVNQSKLFSIKLGFIKNFVKGMNRRTRQRFKYLRGKFPQLSDFKNSLLCLAHKFVNFWKIKLQASPPDNEKAISSL